MALKIFSLMLLITNVYCLDIPEDIKQKPLEKGGNPIYKRHEFFSSEKYKDPSILYDYVLYPKIPRLHSYNHVPGNSSLAIELSSVLKNTPDDLLQRIFGEIPKENLNIFLLVQDHTVEQDENGQDEPILLRPHYYIHDSIQPGQNIETSVFTAIFSLRNQGLIIEKQKEGTFVKVGISSHSADEQGELICSPNNLAIDKINNQEGEFFCSIVLDTENLQNKRGVLTFHYLRSQQEIDQGYLSYKEEDQPTIEDFLNLPEFEVLGNIRSVFYKIANQKDKSWILMDGKESKGLRPWGKEDTCLPSDFDVEQYYQNHFKTENIMKNEIENNGQQFGLVIEKDILEKKFFYDWVRTEYLKRHWIKYGQSSYLSYKKDFQKIDWELLEEQYLKQPEWVTLKQELPVDFDVEQYYRNNFWIPSLLKNEIISNGLHIGLQIDAALLENKEFFSVISAEYLRRHWISYGKNIGLSYKMSENHLYWEKVKTTHLPVDFNYQNYKQTYYENDNEKVIAEIMDNSDHFNLNLNRNLLPILTDNQKEELIRTYLELHWKQFELPLY